VGVKVDTFKAKPTQVFFECRYKKATDPDIGLGLASYQTKNAEILGYQNQNPLTVSGAMGNQLTLTVRCKFDASDKEFKVDFDKDSETPVSLALAETKANLEKLEGNSQSAPSTPPAQQNEDLESANKEVVFVGTYKDFTTLTCLNIPTVKEEFYNPLLVQKTEAACLQGCGLAVVNVESSQQPWILPHSTAASRYTNTYPLLLTLQRYSSFDGQMIHLKSLELIYDTQVFQLDTESHGFINQQTLSEQHPFLQNLNAKFEKKNKGEYAEISDRDKTVYYSFLLAGTSNPQGKLQSSKICAEAKYDYQFTTSTSIAFEEVSGVAP
ncbi:MAG: hypothetical protein AABX86_01780, partial [Nanoarchaeota archaeon]